jgi:pimeloyl-ACP methyl ester carboxylesterase
MQMKTHAHRWIVVAAIISVGAGAALSHVIEPGVRVEKIMLTTNTPALRIFSATPGPHPIALLAHGNGGSKEMLFRFGEAFAAAGFDCYSVDQAGYGESPQPWSLTNILLNFQEVERTLGAVDVFIGHSMGGGVGEWSVLEAGFRPKLFIGVGAPVELGEHAPPLLLLGGLFEELYRPAKLKARTDAQVVISPWCDHILEAYDPVLVRAAVKAACAAVGKPVPAAPTAWRWRFAGLVLGIAGALGLMLYLPELHPRLARTRRFIVPAVLLIAVILTLGPWLGVTPQLRRIPQQLVLLPVIWLALAGLSKLRLPRWSLPVVTGILALGCLALRIAYATKPLHVVVHANHIEVTGPVVVIWLFSTLMCTFAISTLLLLPSTLVGRIATRGGSRRDGDIAMAIFASCAIGQVMPLFY